MAGNGRKVQHGHVEHDGSAGGESAFGAGPGGSGSMSHPWQKTEPVGVKTDGLAKSEAYGLYLESQSKRDMSIGQLGELDRSSLVLSCLLTLYTAVMSFEILFPFGLWVSEPGWLLNHSQLV